MLAGLLGPLLSKTFASALSTPVKPAKPILIQHKLKLSKTIELTFSVSRINVPSKLNSFTRNNVAATSSFADYMPGHTLPHWPQSSHTKCDPQSHIFGTMTLFDRQTK